MRPRMTGIGLLAIAALSLLAACSEGSGSEEPRPRPTEVPADAPFIDQDALKFLPNSLTTTAGEVIYFHNAETALHTVTINGTNESGTMRKNDLFQWTPSEAGTYRITCDFHPQMKATITVEAAQ